MVCMFKLFTPFILLSSVPIYSLDLNDRTGLISVDSQSYGIGSEKVVSGHPYRKLTTKTGTFGNAPPRGCSALHLYDGRVGSYKTRNPDTANMIFSSFFSFLAGNVGEISVQSPGMDACSFA